MSTNGPFGPPPPRSDAACRPHTRRTSPVPAAEVSPLPARLDRAWARGATASRRLRPPPGPTRLTRRSATEPDGGVAAARADERDRDREAAARPHRLQRQRAVRRPAPSTPRT